MYTNILTYISIRIVAGLLLYYPCVTWVQDYGVCIACRLHTAHSRRVTLIELERLYMVAIFVTAW
jgi:hypothetical protein